MIRFLLVSTFVVATFGQNPSDKALISIGKATMTKFRGLISKETPWKLLQTDDVTGIQIFQYKNGTSESLMAKLKSPHPPNMFFTEFYVQAENIPKWSPIVTVSKKLKQVDPRTRVLFQNLRAQAALPLDDRTFLILQRTEIGFVPSQGVTYTTAYSGVDYKSPTIPTPGVRADVGVSGFQIKADTDPITGKPTTGTEFTWISTVQFHYDEVPADVAALFERFNMILYVEALSKHVDKLASRRVGKKNNNLGGKQNKLGGKKNN